MVHQRVCLNYCWIGDSGLKISRQRRLPVLSKKALNTHQMSSHSRIRSLDANDNYLPTIPEVFLFRLIVILL